jgi:hypothetical protein
VRAALTRLLQRGETFGVLGRVSLETFVFLQNHFNGSLRLVQAHTDLWFFYTPSAICMACDVTGQYIMSKCFESCEMQKRCVDDALKAISHHQRKAKMLPQNWQWWVWFEGSFAAISAENKRLNFSGNNR